MSPRSVSRSDRTDEQILQHFVHTVEQCVARDAIRLGTLKASMTFHYTGSAEPEVTTDMGNLDHFMALSGLFRKFIGDDDANVFKVSNHLHADEEHQSYNAFNRAGWTELMEGKRESQPYFYRGETRYAGERTFRLWCYGEYLHSDPQLEALYRTLGPEDKARCDYSARQLVSEGLRIVHAQRNVANVVLGTLAGVI
jgi:hypothetical protein